MPDLAPFIEQIKSGGVVAFPTETVYGLGADAKNASAVKKVFELKGRPADNPLIVHVASVEDIKSFVLDIPEVAHQLIEKLWPGPLTMVLKKNNSVLDLITAGLDTVAIRMPDHPLALEFISETGALVAPSANKSGGPSPTKAEHVKMDFGTDFPVIDGGATKVGLESTVLDLSGDEPAILRPGKIGVREIEDVLDLKVSMNTTMDLKAPKSPGQKYSHYKPKASVYYGNISSIEKDHLYLIQNDKMDAAKNVLQYNGDLELLSQELYDRFRQADTEGYKAVFIEEIESYQNKHPSLYLALKNRIDKAKA